MIMRLTGWMLALVACVGLIACGGGGDGEKGKPGKAGAEGAEKKSATVNVEADDPGVAIQSLLNAVSNGEMGAAWEAMPARYQKDVNDVVHLAAEKMDKEIYDKIFVVLAKGIDVFKKQKKFIAAQPQLAMLSQEEKDKLAAEGWMDSPPSRPWALLWRKSSKAICPAWSGFRRWMLANSSRAR